MVGHGGSSAGSYLADPTSPIPSHCASIVATSTIRVNSPMPYHGHCIESYHTICICMEIDSKGAVRHEFCLTFYEAI